MPSDKVPGNESKILTEQETLGEIGLRLNAVSLLLNRVIKG